MNSIRGSSAAALGLSLWVALWVPALAMAEKLVDEGDVFAFDERFLEADALLEHRKDWGRAIELYRATLADDPEHWEARLNLARVLSWSKRYSESFTQYYELQDRRPDSREVRTQLAEVLSWAGRYEDSEQVFVELLEEDPGDPRAALGLARVYSWSGRSRQAQRAYERVLEINGDDEARGELDALKRGEGFGTHAKANSDFISDSGKFRMFRTGANASTDVNDQTRVLVRAGYTNVRSGLASGIDQSTGLDLVAGVERVLRNGLTMRLEAGARRWSSSPNTALARAELKYTPSPRTAMGFEVGYSDFLEAHSLEAVLGGLHETRGRTWLWRELAQSIEGYGYLEASYISASSALVGGVRSGSNARLAGGLSVQWKPWHEFPMNVGAELNTTSYTSRSELYYDPKLDVSASLFAQGAFALHRSIDFSLRADVGIGHARESAASSTGLSYSIEGGPAWHYDAWSVSLLGRYSQTIRGTPYSSRTLRVTLGRGF